MKRKRVNPVHQFLDVEAAVENSDGEEDEEDAMDHDDFIEETTIDSQYTPSRWRHFEATDGTQDSDFITALEECFSSGSGTSTEHFAESNRKERPLESEPAIISSIDNISRLPAHNDYPLWRVRCKQSLEDEIVFSLLEMAHPRHEIRSAFSHWSVRGWVYLEATMNKCLHNLLQRIPGIIHTRFGLIQEHIDFSDGVKLLSMHLPKATLGGWVRVWKGVYRGDIGFVTSMDSRGVQLLLVPRLSPPQASEGQVHPLPTLLDHEDHGVGPVLLDSNIYMFRSNRFEHGLITKPFSFDSISAAVSCMPLDLFSLFIKSGHPKLIASASTFPIPSEWHFEEGDQVYIVDDSCPPAYESGVISTLRTDSADVTTKEGIVCIPWLKIAKVICEGDFVEVTSGTFRGQTGWVVAIQLFSRLAHIIPLQVGDQDKLLSDRTEPFEVHVNSLKHTTVPHVLARMHPKDNDAIPPSERILWLGTEIIVTGRHWYKTCKGVITNVLHGQHTPSGLRVEVCLDMPFRHVVLDYDHVGDASYGRKLHRYAPPISKLFEPRNAASEPPKLWPVLIQPSLQSAASAFDGPGYATLMPQAPFSSSLAWDPGSSTPRPEPDHRPERHNPSPVQVSVQHILLDSRLLNAHPRVVVTGGGFTEKEMTVSVQTVDGQLSFRRHIYKRSEALDPKWVTPKYPNMTRDNGLFIVIKGDHCGKYVLWIHHRYDGNVAIAILAVVCRVAGLVDNLTGDLLELDASYLCVCEVSKEDKQLHHSLANALRERARKTRAR